MKENNLRQNLLIQMGLVIMITLMLFFSAAQLSAQDTVMRRHALYIGSNYGGRERVTLSYAVTDARTVADVMQQLGGVMPTDSVILTDPSPAMVKHTITEIRKNIESDPSHRSEFFFYYSGHSDDEGLLLGDSVYSYAELKNAIDSVEADVNIAVLDSCSSGAFTRMKGGVRRSPFLSDSSLDATGHAFLTSSSEDEAAQESDDLGASFFTHYFVTALRGAGDSTLDGTVSLNEAYSYASSETLARTEETLAGPQHPSYDIQLAGTGDLVLTDLRSVSEQIVFEENLRGRIFVRDSAGRLVVELKKIQGTPLAVSIGPGRYSMILDDGDGLLAADLVLSGGTKIVVMREEFYPVPRTFNQVRGGTHVAADDGRSVERPSVDNGSIEDNSDGTADTAAELDSLADYARGRALEAAGMQNDDPASYAVQAATSAQYTGDGAAANETAAELDIIAERARRRALAAGGVTGDSSGAGAENYETESETAVAEAEGTVEKKPLPARGDEGLSVGIVPAADNLDGIQIGTIGADVKGALDGIQIAGIYTAVESDIDGIQIAGIWSAAGGDLEGAQISGIWNSAVDVSLLQLSGIFNIAEGNVDGLQFTGIFNSAEGDVVGGQIAGIFNTSKDITGLQIAGIFNVAADVIGGQIGLLNFGGVVKGVQIGLINISDEMYGVPIGLINISGNGLNDLSVWYGHNRSVNFGYQLGTPTVYSFITAGFSDDWNESASVGLGMGLELGVERFFCDVDLYASSFQSGQGNIGENLTSIFMGGADVFPAARFTAGFEIFEHLSVFAGVNLDCAITGSINGNTIEIGEIMAGSYSFEPVTIGNEYGNLRIYPEWFVGVRI